MSQPIYKTLWDGAGKPYWATTDGGRMYIPPIVAAQYRTDPKLLAWAQSQGAHIGTNGEPTVTGAPSGSLLRTNGTWNDETGNYDQGINWGNLGALGIGAAFAAPAIAGLGGAAAGAGAGSAAAGTGAASAGAGGTAAGLGAAGAASHFLTSPVGAQLVGGGISALANIWGANKGAAAADRAAQLNADAAKHAADLEAANNAATLKFLQEQEATRKAEFEKTQAQNYGIYQTREANLQPYRNWGIGAMAQLGRPIGAA